MDNELLDDFTAIKKDHSNSTAEPTTLVEPSGGGQPGGSLPLNGDGGRGNSAPSPSGDPEPPAEPSNPAAASSDPAAEPHAAEPPAEPTAPNAGENITPDNGLFTTIEDTPPADPPAEPVNLDFKALSEGTGYVIESQDDVVQLVNQLKNSDPYEGVSPLLRQAIDVERGGGDVKQFLSVLAIDVDNLSDKKALFEDYLAKNPNSAKDLDYAQEKFEREYNAKYGILADEKLDVDFDSTEEYQAYLRDRDFAKKELAHEAALSKEGLRKTKEDALANIPSAKNAQNDEKVEAVQKQYIAESTEFMNSFETLQIPIDEEGKTFYNVPLNEDSKPLVEAWAKSPAEFLEDIGIPSDGGPIDTEKLLSHMVLTATMMVGGKNSFGNRLYSAMTERINANTLEHQLENPAPTSRPAPAAGSGAQMGELDEAIEALAGSVQQQRRR